MAVYTIIAFGLAPLSIEVILSFSRAGPVFGKSGEKSELERNIRNTIIRNPIFFYNLLFSFFFFCIYRFNEIFILTLLANLFFLRDSISCAPSIFFSPSFLLFFSTDDWPDSKTNRQFDAETRLRSTAQDALALFQDTKVRPLRFRNPRCLFVPRVFHSNLGFVWWGRTWPSSIALSFHRANSSSFSCKFARRISRNWCVKSEVELQFLLLFGLEQKSYYFVIFLGII